MQIGKEVAPKAEEEGAESSSSETNGPVTVAAAIQEGGAKAGRRCRQQVVGFERG